MRSDEDRRLALTRVRATGAAAVIADELYRVRSQLAEMSLRSRRMPKADQELMKQLASRVAFLIRELARERAHARDTCRTPTETTNAI